MSKYHAKLEVEDETGEMEEWEVVFKRVSTSTMLTLSEALNDDDTTAIQKVLTASEYLIKSFTFDGTSHNAEDVPFDVLTQAVSKSPFLPQ